MKTIKIAIVAMLAVLAWSADYSPDTSSLPVGFQLVSEAQAVLGVRRRAARRGVAVGYAAGEAAATESQQQAAAANQQAAAAAAPAPTPAPEVTYGLLPEGTVINVLPSGCATTQSAGVEYYHCGDNYFRAAFQGNNLVYVSTTAPAS